MARTPSGCPGPLQKNATTKEDVASTPIARITIAPSTGVRSPRRPASQRVPSSTSPSAASLPAQSAATLTSRNGSLLLCPPSARALTRLHHGTQLRNLVVATSPRDVYLLYASARVLTFNTTSRKLSRAFHPPASDLIACCMAVGSGVLAIGGSPLPSPQFCSCIFLCEYLRTRFSRSRSAQRARHQAPSITRR
jgi:hypothetical protein